jgi:hypothetical protein
MLYGYSMYAYYHMDFMLVQGSLFPLIVLFQQACLALSLFKGACSL